MKSKYLILFFTCLSISFTAEAQIFKKLKEKVAKAVSKKENDSISENIKEKKKKNGGVFGKLFNVGEMNQGTKTNPQNRNNTNASQPAPADNNVKLPDSYNFSYQAIIQVTSNNNTAEVEYLLQPNETYYAKKQTKNGFTEHIVYDNERSIEVYYAEIEGQKRQARKKMGILTKVRLLGAYKDAPGKQVKPLGSKKLLGFNCDGYEIKTQEGTTQFWVTSQAPATLYGAMFKSRAEAPNSPFTKNSMIMEVTYTSNEAASKNYQMVCTQLQPKNRVFNKTDYIE